jgi:HEAT repeat protein
VLPVTLLAAGACGVPPAGADDPGPTDQHAKDAIALLESDDPYQRQVGFLRLEALRDPSTLGAVRRSLDAKDPERRAEAVRALAAIQGAQAVPQLLDILRTDKHPLVRRAALLGLEPLPRTSPDILPAFLAALRDRKPEVRMTAIDIVSRIDDPRAREAIRKRNRWERDRNVRRVLWLAMNRLTAD